ncbi:MAG: PH domain-containing protein [Bdellovibrionales bacterium]|nr:PH domain-containing protein [Bdellovibrionales bacterium]
MEEYPEVNQLLKESDSEVLLILRPSYRSFLGLVTLGIVTLSLTRLVIWSYPEAQSLRWLLLVPFLFFTEILRRRFNNYYRLMSDKIEHYAGRLSFNYSVPVVKYNHIRAISVSQSIIGRILNFGDVSASTAAEKDDEMVLKGMVNPKDLARLLEELRRNKI